MNTNKKRILISGTRAPAALDLARHFYFAGHEVMSVESLNYPLCKTSKCITKTFFVPSPKHEPSNYRDQLLEIIKREKIDLFIPTCEEIYTIAKYKEVFSPFCEVFCDDFEKLIRLHDKWQFMECIKDHQLASPKTWKLESRDALAEFIKEDLPFDVILKPVFSRFSSDIYRLNKNDKHIPNLDISSTRPWIAQQFLCGPAYCCYAIVQKGEIHAYSSYPVNLTANGGACIYFESVQNTQMEHWVKEFVKKINFTGQIAFDFIEDIEGHCLPIECNPRATSGVHLFNTGEGLEKAFLCQLSSPLNPRPSTKKMVALAMLMFGKLKSVSSWIQFFNTHDVLFDKRDLKPFFFQFVTFFQIWRIAKKTNKSLLAASTHDIEWNGGI